MPKMTKEEKKLILWVAFMDQGWTRMPLNCLEKKDEKGTRVRLNFRESDHLTLEVKRPFNEEEQKANPQLAGGVWDVLEKGLYEKMIIAENGAITFPKDEKSKATKTDGKSSKKNKE